MKYKENTIIFIGNERQRKLADYLQRQKATTSKALAEVFEVSDRTIRSDIKELCKILPIMVKSGRFDGGIYWVDDKELYNFR